MIPQQVPDTPVNLIVHVDKDGDPLTKQAGDLLGTCANNPISLTSQNIIVNVNELLK